MIVGGNFLNLLAIEEEELSDAGWDCCPDKILPDFLALNGNSFPVSDHDETFR